LFFMLHNLFHANYNNILQGVVKPYFW